jgi:hypothetical protein
MQVMIAQTGKERAAMGVYDLLARLLGQMLPYRRHVSTGDPDIHLPMTGPFCVPYQHRHESRAIKRIGNLQDILANPAKCRGATCKKAMEFLGF